MRPIPLICLNLLRQFEGFTPTAKDDLGVPAIGMGHRIFDPDDPLRTMTIDEPQAEHIAAADMMRFAAYLYASLGQAVCEKLTESQWAALLDFVYNIKTSQFHDSTLRKLILAGDMAGAGSEFAKWVFITSNGQKVLSPGLERRRSAEQSLWMGLPTNGSASTVSSMTA